MIKTNSTGQTSPGSVFAAGHCTGITSLEDAVNQGMGAGLACALSIKENAEVKAAMKSRVDSLRSQ